MPDVLAAFAAAKVNLDLAVLGRRADGYHLLESLVAFADVGDRLTLEPGRDLGLSISGPRAGALAGEAADGNLVIRAARALAERVPGLVLGRFALEKHLPVASGIGGGSADAAAALRLLARANGLALDDPRLVEAARATGADVPVCLAGRVCVMSGIGEVLSAAIALPPIPAVLVNPGIPVETRAVFSALGLAPGETRREGRGEAPSSEGLAALIADLARRDNDLEAPAIALAPVIAQARSALAAAPGCRLARMSGSGATCFGLFASAPDAKAAASALAAAHPAWWVASTTLSASPSP